jgi:hypothetical protein
MAERRFSGTLIGIAVVNRVVSAMDDALCVRFDCHGPVL